MPSLLPLTFFEDFMPSREKILVISGSQYAEYKRHEAQKQIEILEARADEYIKALATIQATIEGLKQEHGITELASQQKE
jgi:hypothetical protein